MLTEGQKTEIRRHLGYPEPATALNAPAGPPYQPTFGQAGPHIGDRYTPSFYDLEYRFVDLPETGEVAILGADATAFGNYSASASAFINVATAGDAATIAAVLPLQIGTEAMTVTVAPGDDDAAIAANIVAGFNDLTVASGAVVAIPMGSKILIEARTPGNSYNTFALRAWGNTDVTLSVTDTTDSPSATTMLKGGVTPPGPSYTDPDASPQLTIYGHLPLVRFWESGIPKSEGNMDMMAADVYKVQPHEYAKRRSAYISACRDMAQTMAVVYFGGKSYRGATGIIRVY